MVSGARRRFVWRAALVAACVVAARPTAAPRSGPPVAAAANLNFVLEEIADRFARDEGEGVRLVFGSSGSLARQITQGAPFELFLSADEQFPR